MRTMTVPGKFFGAAQQAQVANKECIFTFLSYDGGATIKTTQSLEP